MQRVFKLHRFWALGRMICFTGWHVIKWVHTETLSCQTHAEHMDFKACNFSHQWCFCDTLGILSFLSNWNFSYHNIVQYNQWTIDIGWSFTVLRPVQEFFTFLPLPMTWKTTNSPCTGSHAGFLLSHVRGFNFEAAKSVKN
jgi:hypothetical protein